MVTAAVVSAAVVTAAAVESVDAAICTEKAGGHECQAAQVSVVAEARQFYLYLYLPTAILKSKGYMPTTIRNMIINVVNFYKQVEHAFLKPSKLKSEDITPVLYALKRLLAEIHKDVVVSHQKVKHRKTSELGLGFFGTSQIPVKKNKKIPKLQGLALL